MSELESVERPTPLLRLRRALERGTLQNVKRMLAALHPAEIANLLESLPPAERKLVWEMVDPDSDGEVLLHVTDEVRTSLLADMDLQELRAATEDMDLDDLADLLQDLPEAVSAELLRSMDLQNRRRLEAVLSYPEDSAGGLMNTDPITVRADVTLDVVLRYLRLRGEIPAQTDSLMVVDRANRYQGVLPLSALLINDPAVTVAEVMNREMEGIPADTPAEDVAILFEQRDFISAPVVDANGVLLGRITIDDVVDVIREQAEHNLMSMAGLDEEEDMFAPVLTHVRRRIVWLCVNLVSSLTAAFVISLFEGTLEKIVVLASLMPIVASMGGVAGNQTVVLMIRGMALGQVDASNARPLLLRELAVGALNGLLLALVVGLIAFFWFGHLGVGLTLAAALVCNLLVAALAGGGIPLLLRKLGIDPALAGSMMLTSTTDMMGFFVFLGLATWFLL
ncbi:MAG TPA: magnesium transporter [Candidatus Competibacteraceae bacterium]|nr:magnesium transporter [Candidatus Competibacteraceae bacterium]